MKSLGTINDNDFEPQDYTIRNVVRAVILDETKTKVLLFGNHFPGGGVEGDETDEEAVARECMEEIGAVVEIMQPIGEIVGYGDFTQKKYIVRGYVCKMIGELGTPTTTDPKELAAEIAWFTISDALTQFDTQIKTLSEECLQNPENTKYQNRIHNRTANLILLREVVNNS